MKKRILLTVFLMAFAIFAKAQTTHWTFDEHAFDGSMSLTAAFTLDGSPVTENAANYEVGAFVGDECRGSYLPDEHPFYSGTYIYYMTVYGENGDEVTFRLYDHNTDSEVEAICNTALTFEKDGDAGDLFEPYLIEFIADPTPRYPVTVAANPTEGGTVTGGGNIRQGDPCTVTATANEGYTFLNWTMTAAAGFTPAETDIDFSEQGYENAEAITEVTLDDYVSVEFFPGTNNTNAPKYYTTGAAIRCYNGNYFVVSSTSGPMTSITLTFGSGDNTNPITTDVGEFDGDTWEGEATSVTFTIGGTSKHRRIQALEVSYLIQTGGGTETIEDNPYTFNVSAAADFVANFEIKTYEIAVSADPEEQGSVIGGGIYEYGDEVELVATPNSGYEFVNWTKGGQQVSTSATYTFDAEDGVEGEYVAHFSTHVYVVTVAADPADGGIVTGGGNFAEGQECKLRAVAGPAHNFVNWMLNGEVASTEANYTFTIANDTEGDYTANFEAVDPLPELPTELHWTFDENKQYSMTVTGIMVLDGESWQNNALVQYLEIGAFSGAECMGSFLPSDYTSSPFNGYFYEITLHSNVASGEQILFRVYNHIKGEEMDVTSLINMTFNDGDDHGSLMEPYELEFATNTIPHYIVTAVAVPAEAGIVSGSDSYEEDATCTLEVTANYGYSFVNWTDETGAEVSTETTYSFTVTGAASYFANFSPIPYDITASVNPAGTGTVEGDGTYDYNTQCTLIAEPATGYHFVNWTEDDEEVATDATYSFIVEGARALVANFAINTYDIVATPSPDATIAAGGGTVTGSGTYEHFATCTLIAVPYNEKWVFENWTENDVVIDGATDTLTFEVTGPRNLVANFAPIYTITASVDQDIEVENVTSGTIEGAGDVIKGQTWTLTETPDAGYTFVNWYEVVNQVREFYSDEATISEEAQADREFVAYYTLNSYDIVLSVANVTEDTPEAAPAIPGSVTGDGTYHHYDTCTLVATPEVGFHFVNWTENNVEVATTATYEFVVTEGRTLVANFELDTHVITLSVADVTENIPEAAPAVPGTVTGADTYNYYATCTVVATPEVGYHFVNWTENGAEVATTATYEFMVEGDRDLVANFELDTHTIVLSVADVTEDIPAAAPAVPGTVTGDGTYNYYATCTLVATPATGYHFVNWTESGQEVSTSATYEFMITEDRSLVANFELDTHTITLSVADVTENIPSAAPAVPGTVTGDGTYNYYAMCTVEATPATGYHFVNWTENGTEVSTSATYEFMVEGDRALVANFELDTHVITVTLADVTAVIPEAAPAVPGTVTGDGTYNYYATCTLVATPATGYHFVNWTENGQEVSTSATYEFMVTEDRALVANFELDTHTITLSVADVTENIPSAAPAVPGTVTGDGTYNYYAMCTVVATPATGYHFVNWTVNGTEVSTSATYEFMVEGDRALVTNFELDTHNITLSVADVTENIPSSVPAAPGTVTGDGTYNYYATCTLVASPATGYHFVNWTENGTEVSASATYEFMVTEDRALVANFELDTHVITLSVADVTENIPAAAPSVPGTVTGDGTYNYYATCTLVATPATGYHFVNWTVNGTEVSASATYEFMVEGDRALVANFELDSYTIATSIVPAETPDNDPDPAGVVTGSGTYTHYSTCELTATANTGYTFVSWTLNGTVVSTDATYSFMVTGPATYVANFEINTYTITATDNPSGFGTITGAGTYEHFSTCTLTATAGEGHTFFNWSENDVEVSTTATYSFTVTGPRTLVAHFINRYVITVAANPTVGGTVTGAGTYDEGTSVTLTATPATGYHFVNWTLNGNVVSTNATYTFTALAAGDYVANFEINNYAITAVANPTAGGVVTGAGNYDHFSTCTLTATANTGYTFLNWTKNGTVVSTNTTYSFMVESAADFVANFQLNSYAITATLDPTDAGTVTGAGTYNHFETCTLTANPSSSYLFVNWTKNGTVVSTDLSISFEVTGPAAYVAHFIPNTYVITATAVPSYAGTVTGAGTYYYNTTCTLTATPNTGHHFMNWTKNGTVVSTEESISFTVTANEEYVAHFDANVYQVTLFAYPSVGGTVTGGGAYPYGQTCVIEAVANEGYTFVEWKLNDDEVISTTPTYMFNVTENVAFVAYFALETHEITATANPADGGTVTGAGTYNHGESCTLTAAAAEGYTFVNWTLDGVVVSTSANYTFTVTESNDYVANFSLNSYEITATANPMEGGSVTGAGNYNYGASCTLTATPATGYNFVNWTKNGTVVSTEASYSFTVTGAGAYVANFEIITFVITATVAPDGAGEVEGAGTYNYGATVTMTATAAEGYRFVNWTEGDEVVSVEETFTFTALSDRQLVAHFQSTVGVGETEWPEVSVYPNPATDKLYIETHRQSSRCEIYTITGAMVYSQDDCIDQIVIEVSDFTAGAYIVRIISDSMVQNIRFIKQ